MKPNRCKTSNCRNPAHEDGLCRKCKRAHTRSAGAIEYVKPFKLTNVTNERRRDHA